MPATPQLLSYAAVRARATTRRTGTVPPLCIAVKVAAHADPTHPATLLERCVAVAALTHPILDRLLLDAGGRRDHHSYLLPASTRATPGPATVHALAAAHPSTWRTHQPTHRVADVRSTFGDPISAALEDAGAPLGTPRVRRMTGMSLRVHRTGTRLRITPSADQLTVDGHTFTAGPNGRVLLTPLDALRLIDDASSRGLVVLAEDPAAVTALARLAAASCTVTPTAAAPGWAQLHAGRDVTIPTRTPVPANDAIRLADDLAASGTQVAVHPHVTQVAAATAAAAAPTTRPGLLPWQETLVDAYLAVGPGLVNALPPGAGKTVCAATAMADRAARTHRYRGIVLAPATLRDQWSGELSRFFPSATVTVATTSTDLLAAVDRWTSPDTPHVLVTTVALLARNPPAQHLPCTDLVVDEATFLTNPATNTSRAAWALRREAGHAMVLTGTPDHRSKNGTGELLAYARNTPDEFAALAWATDHPLVPHDRAGVLVFTGDHTIAAQLPDAAPDTVVLDPGPTETTLLTLARDRIDSLLGKARPAIPVLRTELEALRLAFASPAALLASGYGLATAAHATAVPAGLGVKGEWALARTHDEVTSGRQVLIFSDFAAALTPFAAHLTDLGVRTGTITSAVHPRDRQRAVAAYTRGDLDVLLVSATGHLGLNLQTAATVIHLDVPTSAATLRQRTARAARLGAAHATITTLVPVISGGPDEHLLTCLLSGGDTPDTLTLARQVTADAASVAVPAAS